MNECWWTEDGAFIGRLGRHRDILVVGWLEPPPQVRDWLEASDETLTFPRNRVSGHTHDT